MRLPRLALTSLAAALVGVVALPGVAAAAPPRGAYTGWSAAGAGSLVVGFPDAAVTAVGTTPSYPGGTSAFLNANTPFGTVFGSSQGAGYLSADVASGAGTTSTTTVAFTSATPASGWGFAVGDVDAETVLVSGTGPGGVAVTAAQLGTVGTFNGCVTPQPGSCPGDVPGDVPLVSDTATGVLATGQVPDSTGATVWFRPTSAVESLTFTSTKRDGIGTATRPVFQVWVAALAADVAGTVTPPAPDTPVADVPVTLELPDGSPLVDPVTDAPVVTTTDADGGWSVPGVVATAVVVVVEPPAGVDAARSEVPVDLSAGDVVDVVVPVPSAAVVPTPPTTAPPTTGSPTPPAPVGVPVAPVAVTPAPQLAATGTPVGLLALGGGLLLAAGSGAVLVSRARTGR